MAKLIQQYIHPSHPRLYVQQRSDSKFLQAVTFLDKQKRQQSMRTAHLPTALKLAEDWYAKLLRASAGEPVKHTRLLQVPIMEELFESWKLELSGKKREWVEMKWGPVARFWEARPVTEITTQTFKEFFRWRRLQKPAPKNPTLHQDVVLIRQILKFAVEEQHIATIPAVPTVGEILPNPRPWLTHQEWEQLQEVSLRRISEARENPRVHQQRRELNEQMVWMVETMMRVEEAFPAKEDSTPIRFRDCRVEKNAAKIKILICEVQGKRGTRTAIGRRAAAVIYERRAKDAKPEDLIFPVHHREGLTELLKAANLHVDSRGGFTRNFKSFRCTALSFAVLRGTDLLWIARNAGTSVAMLDAFYARRLSAEMAKDELTEKRKARD